MFDQAGKSGEDIRFTKEDNTPLSYEIERWDAAAEIAEICAEKREKNHFLCPDDVFDWISEHFRALKSDCRD